MSGLTHRWRRSSLVARLLIVSALALFFPGSTALWLSATQEARQATTDLTVTLERELAGLPAILAELTASGEVATLEHALQVHVRRRPIAALEFSDLAAVRLKAEAHSAAIAVPAWFRRWLGFEDLAGNAPVVAGGRVHGSLRVTLTAEPAAERTWQQLVARSRLLLLALALDFAALVWVLRATMAPLRRLEQGADALAAGELATRLAEDGAPEIQRVLRAFNRMAEALALNEQKLRAAEERLRAAIDGAALGLWDWYLDSGRLVIDARWAQILGRSSDEIGRHVQDWEKLVHPEDWPRVQAQLQAHLRGETADYRSEHRLQHRDGHWVWVLDAGRVLARDEAGQPVRMVGVHLDISAQKAAEACLQAREQHLRTLIESMDDVMLVVDTAGRIVECHLPAPLQGCPDCASLLGRDCAAALPPAFAAAYTEAIAGLIEDGQSRSRTLAIDCDGERRELHAVFSALSDGTPWPRGFLCIARDITEARRRSAQNRLLVAALEAAASGIVITDRDGIIEWANPAFARLTGYTVSEAIGRKPKELVRSGLQSEAFYRQMWSTILAGEVWQGELINRRRDGSLYHEALNITPVTDEEGAIHHFVAIKQDITARKQEEQAMAEARREIERLATRNALLLESAGEGIFGLDRDGRCVFVNAAALALLGLTREAAIGADWHALCHLRRADGTDYPYDECPIQASLGDGLRREADESFIRADGQPLPVHVTVAAMREQGEQVGVVVVFEDMTARLAMENELRRLANTDGLTGLANRRHFVDRLEQELARLRRYQSSASLLMLDLDHFKRINDRWGHAAGDMVLKSFAQLVLAQLRRNDLAGRLGGEEFAILLPETGVRGASELAERLRLAAAGWRSSGQHDIVYTVSIGLTMLRADDASADSVLARADAALYRAKDNGRNRVEVG